MIGIIYQVGPQHLVSSLIILFCGGQVAAASVGIAVEKQKRCLCLLQISMAIRHMASLGTPQRQPWLTKDTESLCQHTAFVCLHPEGASPPSATSSVNFAFPLRLLCNFFSALSMSGTSAANRQKEDPVSTRSRGISTNEAYTASTDRNTSSAICSRARRLWGIFLPVFL